MARKGQKFINYSVEC